MTLKENNDTTAGTLAGDTLTEALNAWDPSSVNDDYFKDATKSTEYLGWNPPSGSGVTPTLSPKYTVTLDVNGGKALTANTLSVVYGNPYGDLPVPTRAGYSFIGWFTEKSGGSKVAAADIAALSADQTLYAHWAVISNTSYTLSFVTNGGSNIADITAAAESILVLSAYAPTRDGYNFGGWYSDAALTSPIARLKLAYNTTVYAKWVAVITEPFIDVQSDDYFYDAVIWAVDKGITDGMAPDVFGSGEVCTRAQAMMFLWRAMGSPEPTSTANPFTDVSAGDWYCKAILWAVENHITAGTSATEFSPDQTVTRVEFVTFLWRAVGSRISSGTASPFTDLSDTGAYYFLPVMWAVENSVTSGTTPTTFGVPDDCERAEVVSFLYAYFAKSI